MKRLYNRVAAAVALAVSVGASFAFAQQNSAVKQVPVVKQRSFIVKYSVPEDSKLHRVRVVVRDAQGPRPAFDKTCSPGQRLSVAVKTQGNPVRLQVYDDSKLVYNLVR